MTRTTFRILSVLALVLGALSFAATSSAHDGHHDGQHGDKEHSEHGQKSEHGKQNTTFRYTTTLASPDKGCGDHVWANDALKRTYVVQKNSDGSYRLTAFDRGTFTTVAGVSPQGCPTGVDNPRHGSAVTGGITGHVVGYLSQNITGGTFNSHATCAAICDRPAFVSAFFGPSAQQNLGTNMSYAYLFMSKDPSLEYHLWLDRGHAGATAGSFKAVDRGDIATA
jgi:hypothetical protein